MKGHPEKSNQINTGLGKVMFWRTLRRANEPRNVPRTGRHGERDSAALARFNLLPSDHFYVLQCNFDNLIFVKHHGRQLIINITTLVLREENRFTYGALVNPL